MSAAEKIKEVIKEGKQVDTELMNDFFNNFKPVLEDDKLTVGDTVAEVLMGRCPPGTRPTDLI